MTAAKPEREPSECMCSRCLEFRGADGQLLRLLKKHKGEAEVRRALLEAQRSLKEAWILNQSQRAHKPRDVVQSKAPRSARISKPNLRPSANDRGDILQHPSLIHPARVAMLKRPNSPHGSDNGDAAYTAKRARVDSLIDAGRALASAGAARTDVMGFERPSASSTAPPKSSKEHYRPSPMSTDRSVTLDSYRPQAALINRLATIDSYRPLTADTGDRFATIDSYRPSVQRPNLDAGTVDSIRPPTAPEAQSGGLVDLAHPPAHWKGGWDRARDSILVRSPKAMSESGPARSLPSTGKSVMRQYFSTPQPDLPAHGPEARSLLQSSSPLPAVGKEHVPEKKMIGQDESTDKGRCKDLKGSASFGASAQCGACGDKTSEVWSLCVCNNRMCCDCLVKLCILDKHRHCVTCGGATSFILTESVELRHDDFMIWSMDMQDLALGVHYSTEETLQAVIDHLQEFPWACDLWSGRGSTTMAEAFVEYV